MDFCSINPQSINDGTPWWSDPGFQHVSTVTGGLEHFLCFHEQLGMEKSSQLLLTHSIIFQRGRLKPNFCPCTVKHVGMGQVIRYPNNWMVNTKLDIHICGPTSVFHFDPHPKETKHWSSQIPVAVTEGWPQFDPVRSWRTAYVAQYLKGKAQLLEV